MFTPLSPVPSVSGLRLRDGVGSSCTHRKGKIQPRESGRLLDVDDGTPVLEGRLCGTPLGQREQVPQWYMGPSGTDYGQQSPITTSGRGSESRHWIKPVIQYTSESSEWRLGLGPWSNGRRSSRGNVSQSRREGLKGHRL